MPTTLATGVVVWNATPHEMHFYCGDGVVVSAPSDTIINATPVTRRVEEHPTYHIVELHFQPLPLGEQIIREIREETPDALIVGSIIAAQAYPGEVVASVPLQSQRYRKEYAQRLVRSDRFTTYAKKESRNNG
jgi:hypothetical protein